MSSFVLGISAPAAGGKSTLVAALADRLDDAVTVHFDAYAATTQFPANGAQWLADGADFTTWRSPQLATDLADLVAGKAVAHPKTGEPIQPAATMILEAPLGRAEPEVGRFIDFLVYIDTPLEVALARFVLRSLPTADSATDDGQQLAKRIRDLRSFLQLYISDYRLAYREQIRQVKPASDLVVDGLRPVSELVPLVHTAVQEAGFAL